MHHCVRVKLPVATVPFLVLCLLPLPLPCSRRNFPTAKQVDSQILLKTANKQTTTSKQTKKPKTTPHTHSHTPLLCVFFIHLLYYFRFLPSYWRQFLIWPEVAELASRLSQTSASCIRSSFKLQFQITLHIP